MQIHINSLDNIVDSKTHRIKPTKPSINWEHVHPRYKYLARDKDGRVDLYEEEPVKFNSDWDIDVGNVARANSHSSLKPGNCDWTESLVKRPEGV